jgi:glycosyltransferase involved in cell wall biosynthesis
MRTVKVLNVSPTYYGIDSVVGGGEKYIRYLNKAINHGFTIRNIEFSLDEAYVVNDSGESVDQFLEFKLIYSQSSSPHQFDMKRFFSLIENYDVIIVHQCLTQFGMSAAAGSKIAGKVVIGLDHGGGEDSKIVWSHDSALFFDVFVAYSEYGDIAFQNFYNRHEIIFGPVDLDIYNTKKILKRDNNSLLSIGRILPHKGYESVIRTMPRDKKYIIIGTPLDRDYETHLKDLAKILGTNVQFLTGLTDLEVLNQLRLCGIYIQPSVKTDYKGIEYSKPELLGLSALEALATGTRTLVSTAGSLSELTKVQGCKAFSSEQDLKLILSQDPDIVFSGLLSEEISKSVGLYYGHEQYGIKISELIISLLSDQQ